MRERRSILYLANRLPYPPNKGDKIRTFHQIDYLAFSHDVYCACFVDQPSDLRHVASLRRWCKDVIAIPWNRATGAIHAAVGALRGQSMTASAFRSSEMCRRLQRWEERLRFDVAIAFSSMMAPYALESGARRKVIDLCDVDSEKWRDYSIGAWPPLSWLYELESRRLRALECLCVEQADATCLITSGEKALLNAGGMGKPVHVISNGVRPPNPAPTRPSRCGPVIGFVGSMDYKPNAEGVRHFVRNVWPRIVKRIPGARFLIIGRNPTAAVRKLARTPGVSVTGEVEETRVQVMRCRIMIAPLQISRGIPNKVLEAMVAGRPVVATTAVGRTLSARPGRDLIIAENDAGLADEIVSLCHDDDRCDTIGHAGYRYALANHSWEAEMRKFEDILFEDAPDRQELPVNGPGRSISVASGITTATPAASLSRTPSSKFQPQGMQ